MRVCVWDEGGAGEDERRRVDGRGGGMPAWDGAEVFEESGGGEGASGRWERIDGGAAVFEAGEEEETAGF